MKKTLSEHANCAKQIRKELKQNFPTTKFSVTSQSYSMGDNVRVEWTDGPTETEVEFLIKKYQYGHFDGMQDLYEYTNSRDDIPQVKFVMTERDYSEEAREKYAEIAKNSYHKNENDSWDEFAKKIGRIDFKNFVYAEYLNKTNLEEKEDNKQKVKTKSDKIEIVEYSEKAIAIFGNTKEIKDQLKEIGGRFNKFLNHKGKKRAGWIFPKTKVNEVSNLF